MAEPDDGGDSLLHITSCGIQQNHPIDGHKSLPLEASSSSHQLSAYVAAAAASSGGNPQSVSSSSPVANSGVLPESTGVGIGSVSKWDEPYFDDTTPHNVTALVGKSAYLSCRVKNLGNKTVSWIRHRDIHILTVGSYTYTSDQRFQATHHKNTDDWTLQIKWAQKRDAGIYECQISTQPVRSYFVTLSVVGKYGCIGDEPINCRYIEASIYEMLRKFNSRRRISVCIKFNRRYQMRR
ncbi:uncharacterized protein LOC110678170 [Aedes aegypti]|uniref:Uncharacterized protein n=1 Tax=Aedes aegypti TaxID=7159 RepID=A0A6I8TMJ4_AEDAE|nr:uncharacterized protein LOC110678170 [Aedes aegypti]